MNSFFTKRRRKQSEAVENPKPPRYGDNGYPIDDIPSNERPRYESDDSGLTLASSGQRPSEQSRGGYEVPGRPASRGAARARAQNANDADEADAEPVRSASGAAVYENGGQGNEASSYEYGQSGDLAAYDFDAGLTDYYNRLAARLKAYGVTDIPGIEQLYGLFESFLRPSVEAAIRQRERSGAYNMAELDADAYARGMGGSSYLSSMKAREQDDINDDIMGLEAKYGAAMAEYLYKALTTMQELEASLAKTAMQYGTYGVASSHSGGSGSHSGGSSSGSSSGSSGGSGGVPYGHNSNGAYFDGEWVEGDFSYLSNPALYNDYAGYISSLTPGEVYLLFTSSKREWRMKRWQMQYNLNQYDYNELYATYFAAVGGGSAAHGADRGGLSWQNVLY